MNLSYNLSSSLIDSLNKIGLLRQQILTFPIPPKAELRFRWEAIINRIYWSLSLTNQPLEKSQIIKILTHEGRKRLSLDAQEAINYKKALDYINQEWLVSPRPVTPKTILTLYQLACDPRFRGLPATAENELKHFLDYLQAGTESPVVKAGIAQIQLLALSPFPDGNGRVARLLGLLFLYKYGFDFRGLLVLDEYFRRDLLGLEAATKTASEKQNLTLWLEYFAQGIVTQLQSALRDITHGRFETSLPSSFWELNDRQKGVLTLLEEPEATITNKKVQKRFKVSQITASRDLAKLASLGLLFAHGRGRSVYYTRA